MFPHAFGILPDHSIFPFWSKAYIYQSHQNRAGVYLLIIMLRARDVYSLYNVHGHVWLHFPSPFLSLEMCSQDFHNHRAENRICSRITAIREIYCINCPVDQVSWICYKLSIQWSHVNILYVHKGALWRSMYKHDKCVSFFWYVKKLQHSVGKH